MTNKERITITIDPGLLKRIDAVSQARGQPRSTLMERMLAEQIASEEAMVHQLETAPGRAFASAIAGSPFVLRLVAKIAGRELSDQQLEKIVNEVIPADVERGRQRQQEMRKARSGAKAQGG